MKDPIDHFSGQSEAYRRFRPAYPPELYQFIYAHVPSGGVCWDSGTGNGQVAAEVSRHFREVYATDISENQLRQAIQRPNVQFRVERAEQTAFPDGFFDAILVAQALHWYDLPAFDREARRVLKPGGYLFIWGYELLHIEEEVDAYIDHFYRVTVGPFWAKERRHIDRAYKDIQFGLKELQAPADLCIQLQWSLSELTGYLATWSAVRKYIEVHQGVNPVPLLSEKLKPIWPALEKKEVRFPLFVRAFRK